MKACCPNCYRQISVTRQHKIRRHMADGYPCGGSGKWADGHESSTR